MLSAIPLKMLLQQQGSKTRVVLAVTNEDCQWLLDQTKQTNTSIRIGNQTEQPSVSVTLELYDPKQRSTTCYMKCLSDPQWQTISVSLL